jgi:hypothetical protein
MSLNPEGMIVISQGCKPLEKENTGSFSPNGATVARNVEFTTVPLGLYCRPFGALLVMPAVFQGLTPLANDCRPFGTLKRNSGPHPA